MNGDDIGAEYIDHVPPTLVESGILRTSVELGYLFTALSAAQGELTDPAKNKLAKVKMKAGGEYGYKYSDLADMLKIIRPIFAKHGLCILQFPMNPRRGSVMIVTRIGHKSGQWIEGDLIMPVEDDRPQTLGSAITYGRRYSAGGAAGLSPDEDEDGQVAQDSASRPKPAPRAKEKRDEDGYDPQRKEHQDWLIKNLQKRNVPEERWDDVGNALKGKTSDQFEKVLQDILL